MNGAQLATRKAGQHIGEMAAIEPALPRSATATVLKHVVALKVSCTDFLQLGDKVPGIWLPIAQELSRRLFQRNSLIFTPRKFPKPFIMSSSETLKIAHALRDGVVCLLDP